MASGQATRRPRAFLVELERPCRLPSVVIAIAPKSVGARQSPDTFPGGAGAGFLIGIGALAVSRPVSRPAACDHGFAKVDAIHGANRDKPAAVLSGHVASDRL